MPAPYSLDLRKKVVAMYKTGNYTMKELGAILELGVQTIYRFVKAAKTGNLEAKQAYQKGHSHAISDLEEFENLVKNNDFETVEDIKDHLKKGSLSSIRRALKKINFVKKKPKNLIKSKTKKKSKIT